MPPIWYQRGILRHSYPIHSLINPGTVAWKNRHVNGRVVLYLLHALWALIPSTQYALFISFIFSYIYLMILVSTVIGEKNAEYENNTLFTRLGKYL